MKDNQKSLEVLTEVIKAHTGKDLGDSYNMCGGTTLTQLICKAMELYHQRLLEEAGKELPDKDVVSKYADVNSNNFPDHGSGKMCNAAQYEGIIYGAEWMKEKASALLAIKQGKIDHWKKRWETNEERCDLSDQNVTYLFLENEELKSQLKESKAEVERLKDKIANWVVQMKAPTVLLPIKQEDIDKCLKDKEEANITLLTNELKKFQSSFISQENVEKMVDFYYFMNTSKEAHQALADNKQGEVLDTRKKISGHERGFLIDNPNYGKPFISQPLTIEQVKDQVARKYGAKYWNVSELTEKNVFYLALTEFVEIYKQNKG